MPHIHWVARQNKLEIPRDKYEVNKREIRECDGRPHDPNTIPLTPKPTRKAEVLARASTTIPSSRHSASITELCRIQVHTGIPHIFCVTTTSLTCVSVWDLWPNTSQKIAQTHEMPP